MKHLSVLFFVVFAAFSVNAQQSISGVWDTGNDNTNIEIKKIDGEYVGKIVSSDNAKAQKGKIIMKDVKSIKGVWKGRLYAAQKQKWVDATFVQKGDKLIIKISSGWASKTVEWKKVK